MNGWISILFSLMGGLALLMKNKTSENGGGDFTVVRDGDSTTPSHSGEEMSNKDISVLDVVDDPSLLDVLKITDPDKYEKIAQTIWQNPSYLQEYTRSTKKWVEIDDKESEVIKILEEGILKPYKVVKSQSGNYFIEVFVKDDDNVGITQYAIILKTPDHSLQMIRDYEPIEEFADYMYDAWIENFNAKYAQL